MECVDSLTIAFSGRLVTPGSYRIVVTADGVRTECLATLTVDGNLHRPRRVPRECDVLFSFIDRLRTPDTTYFGRQRRLEVQVTRDGRPVAHSRSEYEVDRPNGSNCDGACQRAKVTVIVDTP
jgi:hypothetical protein